jgi:hypothetical protein
MSTENNSGEGDLTRAVKVVVKLILWGGAFLIMAIGLGAGFLAYVNFKSDKDAEAQLDAQLKFLSGLGSDWDFRWKNKNSEIQEGKSLSLGETILRRVKPSENQEIIIMRSFDEKTGKHETTIRVFFFTSCKGGTEIITAKKYKGGEPVKLICNDSGTALEYSAVRENLPESININLSGFSINERFYSWDTDYLDRKDALRRAK